MPENFGRYKVPQKMSLDQLADGNLFRRVREVDSNNKITGNSIRANTITADHIEAGTITATEINVSQLSEIASDAGIIVGGELRNAAGTRFIDLDASGTEEFIKHDNFTLLADGTATFGGTVTASSFTSTGTIDFTNASVIKSGAAFRTSSGFAALVDTTDVTSVRGTLTTGALQFYIDDPDNNLRMSVTTSGVVSGTDYNLVLQASGTGEIGLTSNSLGSGETVTAGANDSGGSGFRMLRIPN